jgi:hypothetical protein
MFSKGKGFIFPSWPAAESGALFEGLVEITAQTGWRDPSGCLKLTLNVTDLASLLFNLRLNKQEIRTTFAGKRKAAGKHCECQGIRHIAKKCPAREKRRGKRRTRQVKVTRVKYYCYRETG